MPRPVSEKVRRITTLLRQNVEQGVYRPGERFPSTRSVAARHGVSYQTAHRVLAALVAEGLLEARHGSGTYVAGAAQLPEGVLLLFHTRARRPGSFGFHLKRLLEDALTKESIPFRTAWTDAGRARHPNLLPVFWELQAAEGEEYATSDGAYALILNDRRIAGLEASRVDTISTDDYSGGVCAAEVLLTHAKLQDSPERQSRVMILAARADDARSEDRVDGFRSLLPVGRSRIVEAGSWNREDGTRAAGALLARSPSAIFCCNDRLAEGVVRYARREKIALPPIVGFDNAPIAEELNLTTIAVPWQEIVATATEIIKKRMAGNRAMARRQVFAPSPIVRFGLE